MTEQGEEAAAQNNDCGCAVAGYQAPNVCYDAADEGVQQRLLGKLVLVIWMTMQVAPSSQNMLTKVGVSDDTNGSGGRIVIILQAACRKLVDRTFDCARISPP